MTAFHYYHVLFIITYIMATDNALKRNADEYLRRHRIVELMEDLCSDHLRTAPEHQRIPHRQTQNQTETRYTPTYPGFKTGIFNK